MKPFNPNMPKPGIRTSTPGKLGMPRPNQSMPAMPPRAPAQQPRAMGGGARPTVSGGPPPPRPVGFPSPMGGGARPTVSGGPAPNYGSANTDPGRMPGTGPSSGPTGGAIPIMKKGGKVSASSRADGIAKKGKTKGRII